MDNRSEKSKKETNGSSHPIEVEPHYEIVTRRYDSFLIATAFLVTAYATVMVVNMNHRFSLLFLANAISAVGLYLAFFFAVSNFHGSLLIVREQITEKNMAKLDKKWPRNIRAFAWMFGSHVLSALFIKPIPDLSLSSTLEARDEELVKLERPAYIHTWLIPALIFLFWFIVPFVVLPHRWWWTPLTWCIGIPVVWVIIYWVACRVTPLVAKSPKVREFLRGVKKRILGYEPQDTKPHTD